MKTECGSIDPLVTSYVDGELAQGDRNMVDHHLASCQPCRARIAVEQTVRGLLRANRSALLLEHAPASLHQRCAGQIVPRPQVVQDARAVRPHSWRTRLVPVTLAASLIILLSGAVLFEATERSSTVLAAELAADHVKCFAINDLMDTHQAPSIVENAMMSGFAWQIRLPRELDDAGLELVGARPCLYAEGKIAHIMYHYQGQPVSVFMLPRTVRHDDLIEVLGHEAAIWSAGDRTFVLVARHSRVEVQRMSALVKAAFR